MNQLPDFNLNNSVIKKGLSRVVENTGLKGRWQVLQNSPKVILDVGHNKEALRLIAKQINEISYNKLYLVMGFIKEREVDSFTFTFSKRSKLLFEQS